MSGTAYPSPEFDAPTFSNPAQTLLNLYPGVQNVGLTVSQLPANCVFQRISSTGPAGAPLGVANIAVAISTMSPVLWFEYRLRDAIATGNPVLQNWAIAAYNTQAGGSGLICPNVPARLGKYFVDIRPNGDNTQIVLGTNPFMVGRIICGLGQSEWVGMLNSSYGDTTTIAALGLTISPYGSMYAGYNLGDYSTPQIEWLIPADGTHANSAGSVQFLNAEIAASGVSCAIIGFGYGGQSISSFFPGQPNYIEFQQIVAAAGGEWEAFIWFQGAADMVAGTSYASYYSDLSALMVDIQSLNSHSAPQIVMSATHSLNTAYAPNQNVATINNAQSTWCTANGAVWVPQSDTDVMTTGVHTNVEISQLGYINCANNLHRGFEPSLGIANGVAGPTMSSGTFSGATITIPVTQAGGSGFVGRGSWWTRFFVYPKGTFSTPYTIVSGTLSPTAITLTLNENVPGNVDFYFALLPSGQTNNANVMVYDNNVSGDSFGYGRQLFPNTVALSAYSLVPEISINTVYPAAGVALWLTGSYSGPSYTPAGINYQENSSGAFTALTYFTASNGNWVGLGPTYSSAVTGQIITVEDATNSSITTTTASFNVTTLTSVTALTMTSPTYGTASPAFPGTGYLSGGYGIMQFAAPTLAPFTMEAWAFSTSAPNPSYNLVAFGAGAYGWIAQGEAGGVAGGAMNGYAAQPPDPTSSPNIADGAWHHLAIVCTTTEEAFYVDGVLVITASGSNTTGITAYPSVNTYNLNKTVTVPDQWGGNLQEFRLSSIAQYNGPFVPPAAPFTGAEPGVVALYHLNGNGNGVA